MIGRGSFGMPFIFKQIEEFYERGKILKEPEKEEILEAMLEHIRNIFKFEGKVKGAKKARAQAMRYFLILELFNIKILIFNILKNYVE